MRFFGVFFSFHLECSFPMLTWVFPRVSRDLLRHPDAPQKNIACLWSIPAPLTLPFALMTCGCQCGVQNTVLSSLQAGSAWK